MLFSAAVCTQATDSFEQTACDQLHLAYTAYPTSFDPHSVNITPNINLKYHTHEALFNFELGKEITPQLAESWQTLDANSWIINLRQNVFFHDNTPFTAADVIYTFDRLLKSNPVNTNAEYLKSIKTYEAIDEHTIKITTKYPNASLLHYLANIYIIKHDDAVDADENQIMNILENPNLVAGTGLYRYDPEHTQSLDSIRLKLNDNHRLPKTGLFKRINIEYVADHQERLASLANGGYDVLFGVLPNDFMFLRDTDNIKMIEALSMRLIFLQMDTYRDQSPFILSHENKRLNSNPFKDKNVRMAINYAIDRQAILDQLLDGAGGITGQLVPEVSSTSSPSLKPIKPDIIYAKELLDEAGYSKGFKVTLHTPNDRYIKDEQVANSIALMLKKINIDVTVRALPKKDFFPKLLNHEFSFNLMGWVPDDGQVSNSLEALLMTNNPDKQQGSYNAGRYSNAELDDVIIKALGETRPTLRRRYLNYATELAMNDFAIVPLYFQPKILAYNSNKVIVNDPNKFSIYQTATNLQCADK